MIDAEPTGVADIAAASFPKAIGMVYEALANAGLSVLAESDACLEKARQGNARPCKVLYVACPFLLLEALAFDRSAAVFLPAHLVIRATSDGAEVHWINPAALPRLKLPVGAAGPILALYSRISQTFAAVRRPDPVCEMAAQN